ncbi:hypothetical protein [Lichenibacterium dinghuense]|uniref:hypothetical protein n=1 Tax=Lichenibacterium dinghuense TaxID=2895977 RepID=UPI001F1A21B4|nr:hypothetical protein [Lichenibacterium sp. 6Y81]
MTALDQAEAALLDALAAIRAARGDAPPPVAAGRRMKPLKLARYELGLGDKQARRWAHDDEAEGISVYTRGRWFIDVEAAAAKRRGRK